MARKKETEMTSKAPSSRSIGQGGSTEHVLMNTAPAEHEDCAKRTVRRQWRARRKRRYAQPLDA